MVHFMCQFDWAVGAHILVKHSEYFCEGVFG